MELTIGTTIDIAAQQYLDFLGSCFSTTGKVTRLDSGPAALAVQDYYRSLGNELIFRAHNGKDGEWRFWTGRHWACYPDSQLRKDLSLLLGESVNAAGIDLLERTMKLRASVPWNTFDTQPILTLANGVLRLNGRELVAQPYTASDYGTFELPIKWTAAPTPLWDAQLAQLLPDPTDQRTLQEVFGAALFPAFKMQAIGALIGKAGSGKSTATAVLRDILGAERTSAIQASQLSGDHYLPGLVGKFINLDAESEFIKPEDEVILKRISGGDPVTINQKNQPVYEAVLPVKWIMVGEELPKFAAKTEGFWSRLVLVPFDHPIPADQQLPMPVVLDRLRPEYPGVFDWALRGLKRLLSKTGTRNSAFSQSERAKTLLAAHRIYSNPFLEWAEQYAIDDPNASASRGQVYANYCAWMSANGYKPLASNRFAKLMEERGYAPVHQNVAGERVRVWRGLRLAPLLGA